MNNFPPSILDPNNPCSPLSIPLNKTALLLLDFHKFIVASQPPSTSASVLSNTLKLRQRAKSAGMLIVHCLIDLKATTPLSRKMATRANAVKEKMAASPELCGEVEEVRAAGDEFVFWRPPSHVSAMGSYGLERFLEQHGVMSLVLCGFSSSGCVVNTAKGAADDGFVVCVEDACGDRDEEAQRIIMGKLLVGQVHVVGVDGFVAAWEKPAEDDGLAESVKHLEVNSRSLQTSNGH